MKNVRYDAPAEGFDVELLVDSTSTAEAPAKDLEIGPDSAQAEKQVEVEVEKVIEDIEEPSLVSVDQALSHEEEPAQ